MDIFQKIIQKELDILAELYENTLFHAQEESSLRRRNLVSKHIEEEPNTLIALVNER